MYINLIPAFLSFCCTYNICISLVVSDPNYLNVFVVTWPRHIITTVAPGLQLIGTVWLKNEGVLVSVAMTFHSQRIGESQVDTYHPIATDKCCLYVILH